MNITKKFLYSSQHAWQGDEAVQQILVFTTKEIKYSFYEKMRIDLEDKGRIKYVDDNNKGAIYKIQAATTNEGTWVASLRCGFTGAFLWESDEEFNSSFAALEFCLTSNFN